jgi:hypothetical protein
MNCVFMFKKIKLWDDLNSTFRNRSSSTNFIRRFMRMNESTNRFKYVTPKVSGRKRKRSYARVDQAGDLEYTMQQRYNV